MNSINEKKTRVMIPVGGGGFYYRILIMNDKIIQSDEWILNSHESSREWTANYWL